MYLYFLQLFVRYSRLWPIERHAIQVYTRQSLKLFRKQVDLAANFKVTAVGPNFYVVDRNREEIYPEWRKKSYKVYACDEPKGYFCECGFFEHVGILCCHTLRVSAVARENVIFSQQQFTCAKATN